MSTDPNQPARGAENEMPGEALDERLPEATPEAVDSTVGTGSFFAIGCTILVVVVIVVGIVIFLLR